MYLIDTNVIGELRKHQRCNPGVRAFFTQAALMRQPLYISVVTVGELRRSIELCRHRGDHEQADALERWFNNLLHDYAPHILEFSTTCAQVWGKLRVPHPEKSIDKQIAATALTFGLTVVTRNVGDFADTGVSVLNPFT